MPKIDTLFFDAGGTLFRPYPSVGHVYAEVARRHGVDQPHEHLDRRFHDAWHLREGLASLTGKTSDKIEREWWYALVQEVFKGTAAFPNFDLFFDDLYIHFAKKDCWRLFDETIPTLERLKGQGYRLAIISNWDQRLFSIVDDLGLKPYFEHVIASSSVGTSKPGAAIFQAGLDAMKVAPETSLHVGDSLHDDYLGAQKMGLFPVLLDRHNKAYNGVRSIPALNHLEDLL